MRRGISELYNENWPAELKIKFNFYRRKENKRNPNSHFSRFVIVISSISQLKRRFNPLKSHFIYSKYLDFVFLLFFSLILVMPAIQFNNLWWKSVKLQKKIAVSFCHPLVTLLFSEWKTAHEIHKKNFIFSLDSIFHEQSKFNFSSQKSSRFPLNLFFFPSTNPSRILFPPSTFQTAIGERVCLEKINFSNWKRPFWSQQQQQTRGFMW